jgi:23S rRNA (uridine2552-2'-O)-methyltransferase
MSKLPPKRPGKTIGQIPVSAPGSGRNPGVRVHTARKRSHSSTLWLARQLNDPYVHEARRLGYRSRAAFKLLQLDDRYHFLKAGQTVVDLGAAPGGWTQVAAAKGCRVSALDILAMDPVPGATVLHLDFMSETAPQQLCDLLGGQADGVLSDMAAPTTGHPATDHLRIIALCEAAYDFARDVLKPGGYFICKVLQGGAQNDLLRQVKQEFATVRHVKPDASRKDSAEVYLLATDFRGVARLTIPDNT